VLEVLKIGLVPLSHSWNDLKTLATTTLTPCQLCSVQGDVTSLSKGRILEVHEAVPHVLLLVQVEREVEEVVGAFPAAGIKLGQEFTLRIDGRDITNHNGSPILPVDLFAARRHAHLLSPGLRHQSTKEMRSRY
jgi:hypothetical protein